MSDPIGSLPPDIAALMAEADVAEVVNETNVVGFVDRLKQRINQNVEMRYQYGDEPARFMESEVALHDMLKLVKEIPADPDALKIFLTETTGLSDLLGLLIHKNPDIVGDAASALSDMTDGECLVAHLGRNDIPAAVEDVTAFVNDLMHKGLLTYLSDLLALFAKTQAEDEDDFNNVTLGYQILENLIELDSMTTLNHLRVNRDLIPFLLSEILHEKPFSYNKVYAMELLETIMQLSPLCSLWIARTEKEDVPLPDPFDEDDRYTEDTLLTHGLTGTRNFIVALAIYRKQNVETAEQEEFVSNAHLCLQIAFLTPSAKAIFVENKGIQLMIRMIREGNVCLPSVLRTLAMVLEGSQDNCNTFVNAPQGGLKNLARVFMYRGVQTTKKGADALIDEFSSAIFLQLLSNGNPDTNYRVCLKFTEERGERVIRLLDMIDLYAAKVRRAPGMVEREIEALKKVTEIGEEAEEDELSYDERLYLRKCDLGYQALINSINIFLHLASTGNDIIVKLLLGLQKAQNVDALKTITFFVEDYLSHHQESGDIEEKKTEFRTLLRTYLHYHDSLLNTDHLSTYESVLSHGEGGPDSKADQASRAASTSNTTASGDPVTASTTTNRPEDELDI